MITWVFFRVFDMRIGMNKFDHCILTPLKPHNSTGGALHRHRKGLGLNLRSGLTLNPNAALKCDDQIHSSQFLLPIIWKILVLSSSLWHMNQQKKTNKKKTKIRTQRGYSYLCR